MRQNGKPTNNSNNAADKKRSVEDVFDAFFGNGEGKRPLPTPQKLEFAKTELASAAIRESMGEKFRKTHFADTKLMREVEAFERRKKRKEIKEIPFEDGYFRIVRKLSSDSNAVGDVYLAEKITVKDGKEYPGELVVLKMLKNEEDLLDGLGLDDAEKKRLLKRLFHEAGTEIKNLQELKHPHIVSATGEVILYVPEEEADKKEGRTKNARLVAQMEYVPHPFDEYIWSVEGETRLTNDVLEMGVQMLDAISFLESLGLVHNDFKGGNMGVVISEGGFIGKMLDADSIRSIAELVSARNEMKYSPDHCDPEEFMELHNDEIAVNAKPAETIYPLGIALLYAIAERLCMPLETRDLRVGGHAYEEEVEHVPTVRSTLLPGLEETKERTTRVSVIDSGQLRKKLEETREIDERNLIRVYLANEMKRRSSDKVSEPPSEIKKLLEKYKYVIRMYMEPEIKREMNWVGDRKLTLDDVEETPRDTIVNHFKRLLSDFKLDKRVEEECDVEDEYGKLLLGIKDNIRRLTEKYARNNYRWYLSAPSHFSRTHRWYDALDGMLMKIAGLGREDAAEMIERAKKEEKGRSIETVFHPEVFEAIAYCLKPRAERPDAKSLKKIFEAKKMEVETEFPEISEDGDNA
jgi:serine/threonine protein kinase